MGEKNSIIRPVSYRTYTSSKMDGFSNWIHTSCFPRFLLFPLSSGDGRVLDVWSNNRVDETVACKS